MSITHLPLFSLIAKTWFLARPFGRQRLLLVLFSSFLQGLFQVVGVTSIFPFLSLVADPGFLHRTETGRWFLHLFPGLSEQGFLLLAGSFALIMLIAANGINTATEYLRTRYVNSFGHWLRLRLVEHYARQPFIFFLHANPGVLQKKVLGDVQGFASGVLLPLIDAFARLVTVVLLVLTLVWIDPPLAVSASLLFAAFYFGIYRLFGKKRRQITEGLKVAQRGGYLSLNQFLGGIKPVYARDCADYFIARFRRHSRTTADLDTLLPLLNGLPRYIIEPIFFGGILTFVLVMIAGGQNIVSALPKLGVIAMAVYRLIPTFQLLYGQISQFSAMRHTLEEVFDELHFPTPAGPAAHPPPSPVPAAPGPLVFQQHLRLEEVSFQYPTRPDPVLQGLSLTIPKNASVAFVGATGSGKSTLVDLLIGLLTPSAGRLWVDQRELTPALFPLWRQQVGYVPQDIYLLDDTVTRNIAFGIEDDRIDPARIREACRLAQILDFVERELPAGFDTTVGDRGVRLSGGQRQRIGLARALYTNPSVLILDEATSALDNTTESALMAAIQALFGRFTVIIIAHRLSTVKDCDILFYLDNGRITGQGTYDSLRSTHSGFSRLVASRS